MYMTVLYFFLCRACKRLDEYQSWRRECSALRPPAGMMFITEPMQSPWVMIKKLRLTIGKCLSSERWDFKKPGRYKLISIDSAEQVVLYLFALALLFGEALSTMEFPWHSKWNSMKIWLVE